MAHVIISSYEIMYWNQRNHWVFLQSSKSGKQDKRNTATMINMVKWFQGSHKNPHTPNGEFSQQLSKNSSWQCQSSEVVNCLFYVPKIRRPESAWHGNILCRIQTVSSNPNPNPKSKIHNPKSKLQNPNSKIQTAPFGAATRGTKTKLIQNPRSKMISGPVSWKSGLNSRRNYGPGGAAQNVRSTSRGADQCVSARDVNITWHRPCVQRQHRIALWIFVALGKYTSQTSFSNTTYSWTKPSQISKTIILHLNKYFLVVFADLKQNTPWL